MYKAAFSQPKLFISYLSEQTKRIDGSHPIYSTVVKDEYTIRTPDALMTGLATESLIKNCCPDIENPSNLLICDLQHILGSIRIASSGPKLELLLRCPQCNELDPYEIDLQYILPILSTSKWSSSLIIDDLKITFKSPTYQEFSKFSIEDFKLHKQLYKLSMLPASTETGNHIDLLLDKRRYLQFEYEALHIETISNQFTVIDNTKPELILDWLLECDVTTHKKVVDHISASKKESYLPDFHGNCTKCGHSISSPIELDVCVNFRQKLITATDEEILGIIKQMGEETKKLSDDLLKMCWFMRGSISYSEAFSLTQYERECIAKIIESNIEITKESGMPII